VTQLNRRLQKMVLFLVSQLDEALGLSSLVSQYLPSEQMAALTAKLPESLIAPSPIMLLVWCVTALVALAVLEQVKNQLGRLGKGQRLPGDATSYSCSCCRVSIMG